MVLTAPILIAPFIARRRFHAPDATVGRSTDFAHYPPGRRANWRDAAPMSR
jgi:hypothetical protein